MELNDRREDRVFSSTLNSSLKVTNMNGLIGIVLLPSEISKITYLAEETETDKDMEHQDECMDQAPEEPDDEDVSPVNAVALNHLDLDKETRKTMTRGQRKMLVDTMEEIEAQDVGLWSTLRGRHRPPLPHGSCFPDGDLCWSCCADLDGHFIWISCGATCGLEHRWQQSS